VEIKTGIKPQEGRAKHHYIQLTAQALLLEEKFNCLVNRARVVYLQSHDTEWLEIDLTLKQLVLRAITRMEKMYRSEICPNVTPDEGKCVVCEFKPYCYRI
jgi:CRISPR-associated protein Cas4